MQCKETRQLIPGIGSAILCVKEPHCIYPGHVVTSKANGNNLNGVWDEFST
jgi:hypothetical protein